MSACLPPSLGDLERRLGMDVGTLTGPDANRATDALTDATALALAEVSTTKGAEWATTCPQVVYTIVVKAARREFENPEGYRTQNVGEFGATVDAVGVYLTPAEVAQIRRAATGRRLVAFTGTIRTPSAYSSAAGPAARP